MMMNAALVLAAGLAGASAKCDDLSYCVEAAGAFDTLISLGFSCESAVSSVAAQAGADAEQQFAATGLPNDATIGDFCPNYCTDLCKDVPPDESCGGINYCTREVAATMTFSMTLESLIAAEGDAAGAQEAMSKDICALVAADSAGAEAQRATPTCIATGMTVTAGSVVVDFALRPDPAGRTAMESMNRLQSMVTRMVSTDLETAAELDPPEPRTAWYETTNRTDACIANGANFDEGTCPGDSPWYSRTKYGDGATGLSIKRGPSPEGMVRTPHPLSLTRAAFWCCGQCSRPIHQPLC